MKKETLIWIFVILLFLSHFGMMYYGATRYFWLEDDDSMDMSVSAVYFAENWNIHPFPKDDFMRTYLAPYPPLYSILMGILYKVFGNIVFVLKFFNSLFVSLAIPFGYLLFKKVLKSSKKGLLATFLLAITPCFMSHFIWAQSLALPFTILTIWALLHIEKGGVKARWYLTSGISMLIVLFTQPSTAVFLLLFMIPLLFFKDWKKVFWVSFISFAIFLSFFILPCIQTFGLENTMTGIGISTGIFKGGSNVDTSGGSVPSLGMLANAPLVSKMDQPTGFGAMMFLLLICGIVLFFVYKHWKYSDEPILTMIWFGTFFILLYGNALPIKLFPHRVWAFLSIPAVLIVADTISMILKGITHKGWKTVVFLMIVSMLVVTSAYPKWVVNTSSWPPGTVWSPTLPFKEMQGYQVVKEFGDGSIIMPICSEEEKPISMGLKSIPYDPEVYKFRDWVWQEGGHSLQTFEFLFEKNIKYIVVDHNCLIKHGGEATNIMMNQLMVISNPAYANEAITIFKTK